MKMHLHHTNKENAQMNFDVDVYMFVTNQKFESAIDGILGMAPCPSDLDEYSFSKQLAKFIAAQ